MGHRIIALVRAFTIMAIVQLHSPAMVAMRLLRTVPILAASLYPVWVAFALLSDGSPRFGDWANHRWFIRQQTANIAETGFPNYVVHSATTGFFYPIYAFYGGTLYAFFGYLGYMIGPDSAYMFGWWIGIVVSMLSGALIARWFDYSFNMQAVFAIAFGSYPYLITDGFARFAFSEYFAVAFLPMYVAGIVGTVRSKGGRTGPLALVCVASIAISGSHNITFVWSLATLAGACLVSATVFPRRFFSRSVVHLVMASALGILVNSWFLLPALVYKSNVQISAVSTGIFYSLIASFLVQPSVLFSLTPTMAIGSTTPNLNTNLPTLFLVIVLGVIGGMLFLRIVCRRGLAVSCAPRHWRKVSITAVPLVGLVAVMLSTTVQSHTPAILANAQMTYRLLGLSSVLLLTTCVVVGKSLSGPPARYYCLVVACAALVQAGFACSSVISVEKSRLPVRQLLSDNVQIASLYGPTDYRIAPDRYRAVDAPCHALAPLPAVNRTWVRLRISEDVACGGDATASYQQGQRLVSTNAVASDFVEVDEPARKVGIDREGYLVVATPKISRDLVARITLPWAAVAGIALTGSACALLILVTVLLYRGGRATASGRH